MPRGSSGVADHERGVIQGSHGSQGGHVSDGLRAGADHRNSQRPVRQAPEDGRNRDRRGAQRCQRGPVEDGSQLEGVGVEQQVGSLDAG